MKKVFSFILMAAVAIGMANAQTTSVTVDCGGSVKIEATPATGYHFLNWNDNNTENPRTLTDIHADATYKAFFEINHYTITWKNDDGSTLRTDNVNHGDVVTYGDEGPTKEATAQYTYTFAGWSPTIVSPAVGDATYTAEYSSVVNKYTITFLNWNGDLLEAKEWEYGQTPSYEGTPSRPADAEFTYTFSGWDVAAETGGGSLTVPMVTGTATYYAQYNSTKNSYNISTTTIGGNENCVTTGDGTYQYGKEVTLTATTTDNCYRFVKWSDGVTTAERIITVTGNQTYTAEFEKIKYTITVESDNEAQGAVSVTAL